jgi:hypothetical protein
MTEYEIGTYTEDDSRAEELLKEVEKMTADELHKEMQRLEYEMLHDPKYQKVEKEPIKGIKFCI